MKKVIAILGLVGLCLTGCLPNKFTQDKLLEKISRGRVFEKRKYDKYLIGAIGRLNLGIISAFYDLDGNGIVDLGANFEIIGITINKRGIIDYTTKKNANAVIINKDEDSIIDICYVDLDNDGILEKKIVPSQDSDNYGNII